jgi:hypothetical protein
VFHSTSWKPSVLKPECLQIWRPSRLEQFFTNTGCTICIKLSQTKMPMMMSSVLAILKDTFRLTLSLSTYYIYFVLFVHLNVFLEVTSLFIFNNLSFKNPTLQFLELSELFFTVVIPQCLQKKKLNKTPPLSRVYTKITVTWYPWSSEHHHHRNGQRTS